MQLSMRCPTPLARRAWSNTSPTGPRARSYWRIQVRIEDARHAYEIAIGLERDPAVRRFLNAAGWRSKFQMADKKALSSADQMERLRSVHNGSATRRWSKVAVVHRVLWRAQHIAVRHLRGIQKPAAVHAPWIKEGNVIGPKSWPGNVHSDVSSSATTAGVPGEFDNGRARRFAAHRFL